MTREPPEEQVEKKDTGEEPQHGHDTKDDNDDDNDLGGASGDDTYEIDEEENLHPIRRSAYWKQKYDEGMAAIDRVLAAKKEREELEAARMESMKTTKDEKKRRKAEQRNKHRHEGGTSK